MSHRDFDSAQREHDEEQLAAEEAEAAAAAAPEEATGNAHGEPDQAIPDDE